jgi:hypothetical protein
MASEASLGSSALIRGVSLQPDNFLTECKYMLGRVFLPSQTPIRVEAYIKAHQGDAGVVGTDKRMQYSTHLTTPEGKQISLQKRDYHITFQGRLLEAPLILRIIELVLKKIFFFLQPKRPIEDPWVLPSPLFAGAQENNIIQFRWNGTLYEYRLKQLNHPLYDCRADFELCFKQLQSYVEYKALSGNPYLYEEDIPPYYSRKLNRRLTENAQIYSPATKTLSPLTSENFEQLTKHLVKAEPRNRISFFQMSDTYTIVFDAPGIFIDQVKNISNIEKVSLVLDHLYLFILVNTEDPLAPQGNYLCQRSAYIYVWVILPVDIDPSTIHLEFLHGEGRLTFKASPQTVSPTEP